VCAPSPPSPLSISRSQASSSPSSYNLHRHFQVHLVWHLVLYSLISRDSDRSCPCVSSRRTINQSEPAQPTAHLRQRPQPLSDCYSFIAIPFLIRRSVFISPKTSVSPGYLRVRCLCRCRDPISSRRSTVTTSAMEQNQKNTGAPIYDISQGGHYGASAAVSYTKILCPRLERKRILYSDATRMRYLPRLRRRLVAHSC
jgi:hypothetical protein